MKSYNHYHVERIKELLEHYLDIQFSKCKKLKDKFLDEYEWLLILLARSIVEEMEGSTVYGTRDIDYEHIKPFGLKDGFGLLALAALENSSPFLLDFEIFIASNSRNGSLSKILSIFRVVISILEGVCAKFEAVHDNEEDE